MNREKTDWPLPSPEVELPATKKRTHSRQFPDVAMLIDTAILEERLNDVVELYRRLRKTSFSPTGRRFSTDCKENTRQSDG